MLKLQLFGSQQVVQDEDDDDIDYEAPDAPPPQRNVPATSRKVPPVPPQSTVSGPEASRGNATAPARAARELPAPPKTVTTNGRICFG